MSDERPPFEKKYGPVEEYAGGEIRAYHGIVNRWLLLVYALLFVWAFYYLIGPFEGLRPTFQYWGGLGPGLAREAVGALGRTGAIAYGISVIGVIGFFVWVAFLTLRR